VLFQVSSDTNGFKDEPLFLGMLVTYFLVGESKMAMLDSGIAVATIWKIARGF
jgi:hypothetical protein